MSCLWQSVRLGFSDACGGRAEGGADTALIFFPGRPGGGRLGERLRLTWWCIGKKKRGSLVGLVSKPLVLVSTGQAGVGGKLAKAAEEAT